MPPKDLSSMKVERFKAVPVSREYTDEMLDFVNELRRENRRKEVNDPWLKEIEAEFSCRPGGSEKLRGVKLLVRTNDNRVVGLHCVRDNMDKHRLLQFGGNISYLVRPSERRKGYNKINMYIALKECARRGLSTISLTTVVGDKAAERSIRAMGGRLVRRMMDFDGAEIWVEQYSVNVKDAISSYAPIFEYLIER